MADLAPRHRFAWPRADWLVPQPALARFVLRGDGQARATAGTAFGVALSEQACRANAAANRATLWLGPDEHLLLAPDGERTAVESAIVAALGSQPHSLVDVSHRQVACVVQGPQAEWLLESQCPLPLDLRAFPVGMCTRTVYAKTEVVLWRTTEQAFHVEVWRSFAAYLAGMLLEVASERTVA